MVLGSQYMVVAVSWLSEKNIYREREREEWRRDVRGIFFEREDEGNNEEDAACKLLS